MKQYMLSIMKGERQGVVAWIIKLALWPFSLIYRIGLRCDRTWHQLSIEARYQSPKPVVSIGNMTVGGVGKTPLVVWLAHHLQACGMKPAILIRGYMSNTANPSDEVDMLNEQLPNVPVLAGPDRVGNIRKALDTLPVDVFICDDAFQHWPLQRDVDIVAIDATNPFGNGFLLPAGILREPLSSLTRADIFILTKTDDRRAVKGLQEKLKARNPKALIVESCHKSQCPVDIFTGQIEPADFFKDVKVVGFCAIGDPGSFKYVLGRAGARIVQWYTLMDHHSYTMDDIDRMVQYCRHHDVKVLVTTHKDAVKLRRFKNNWDGIVFVYLPVQLEIIKGSDELLQRITSACRR